MSYKTIVVKEEMISQIILNRPEKRNAMNEELLGELLDALRMLDARKDVHVIILKGEGKGFCSGADLNVICSESMTILQKREYVKGLPDVIKMMNSSGKVIIAQVHGFALAGGFGLAMSADLVVCSDDAKLGMPEVKKGLMPMNIMAPVSRAVHKRKLLEMMFTGEYIMPGEALMYGMINKVSTQENLEKETMELAQKIYCNNPNIIKLGKEAYYTIQDMEFMKSFNYLNDMLMMTIMAGDSQSKN
ncbi:enoyl-CoA hydratase/isomerase family protein [Sedimentibacter sp.]|uniref:enoyl-CoA hydratase/isomerase family protein n=1 Tax=Sedimentibacter sp. TaxID=1960295 RepID=UPI00289CE065|nr:enoyl-CoA hydratase/isomerase family protein [Sedimentibacter sp.]